MTEGADVRVMAGTEQMTELLLPDDPSLAFFAYGIFRPGQISFFQIKPFVNRCQDSTVPGKLVVRDGLLLAAAQSHGSVPGAVLEFKRGKASEAYSRIAAMEPRHQYSWIKVEIEGNPANMLVARSLSRGTSEYKEHEWDSWEDPLFTVALDLVEEALEENSTFDKDHRATLRLQMAYLLLWTSVERYIALRHSLGDAKVERKIAYLAAEEGFREAVLKIVPESSRRIYRADRPKDSEVLDRNNPKKSLDYYYQVRCNVTHRGKGIVRDHEELVKSLGEMVSIMRDVLMRAKKEAGWLPNQ